MTAYLNPAYRHDFVLLFDVTDGNPNGDPDGGNMPRTDPETLQGLVTDVALKRKVRNYVATYAEYEASEAEAARLKIFVEHHGVLNNQIRRAYVEQNIPTGKPATDPVKAELLDEKAGKPDKNRKNAEKAQAWMCQNFYDVRMFGAVMSTGLNAGQVRGPMQLTFSRSFDPVLPQDLAVTRVAVTDEKDREKLQTIGRKTFIPYGLYQAHGFYSPYLAAQTGVTEADLNLFWDALINMWDLDRSASRGLMAPRGLYIFTHDNKIGKAPAHKLFERIQVQKKATITSPRTFSDYDVTVNEAARPTDISLSSLI
ncbi:type I-C CRISPR-associated protein Cas7/Csd2 [Synechococcales cyanobacterium C]|uniref:Type I-C CRISPR-associated protein Cas7/Csd2 n=1 Tax=Petrachloros mirabilis ULC683 TaxID=2781853 RepID=A0A8K1ZXS6_9CYAN|nr:type I-C CRISPR-associated protein Cas7/Csd2 [Petrachloros mirabilis]NCJ06058.1 type I-C CRISPR-associated protein Cas7/Csd2 [Petrachloros mirabilis ULC683]